MYSSALDFWYKKGYEFNFSMTCSCGRTMFGLIRKQDGSDKLHCTCGLVWEVKKPYKEQ